MTFNIGNQNAAIINNVAGDQRIEGGQHGTAVTAVSTEEARRAVRELRSGLAGLAAGQDGSARVSQARHSQGRQVPGMDRRCG